ncbi:MAG: hypothetical protein LBP22_15315 [Deltaproteobacteria bacterium]|jgi:hypothetical protein|nr:hypothetical protein [Deltaproteobacteria bacterium]
MESVYQAFLEALKFFVRQEKSQRKFAAKLGISAPCLNDLLNCRRAGEDQTKRKAAFCL